MYAAPGEVKKMFVPDLDGWGASAAGVVPTLGRESPDAAAAAVVAVVRAAIERATALRAADTRRRISACSARPEMKPPPPMLGRIGGRYGVSPVGATERQSGQARGCEGEAVCSLCFCRHSLWNNWWQHCVWKRPPRRPSRMGERQMLHATGDEAVEGAELPGVRMLSRGDAVSEPGEKMLRRAGVDVLVRFRCGVELVAIAIGD